MVFETPVQNVQRLICTERVKLIEPIPTLLLNLGATAGRALVDGDICMDDKLLAEARSPSERNCGGSSDSSFGWRYRRS